MYIRWKVLVLVGFTRVCWLVIFLFISSRVRMVMFAFRIFPSAMISGSSPWSLILKQSEGVPMWPRRWPLLSDSRC